MPQLNFATFLSQAFWLLVSFCSLWAMLSYLVTPKIMQIIEERKRKIDDYIQKAEKLNRQAKVSLENYNNALAAANENAEKQWQNGKEELKAYISDSEKKLAAKLNKKIADNELSLAAEKKETMQQIERISQDLAYAVVQKLGFAQISRQDIEKISQEDAANG